MRPPKRLMSGWSSAARGRPMHSVRIEDMTRTPTPGKRRPAKGARKKSKRAAKVVAKTGALTVMEVAELDDLRRELERAAGTNPLRWNADPDEVQRSVAQLVLTLVEFIRRLLERQAIRRMDAGTLTGEQTEAIGQA